MTAEPCCRRILIDGRRIGQGDLDCVARGSHDWLYDGEVCCRERGERWRQSCHCGAWRWTSAPGFLSVDQAKLVERTISPKRFADMAELHAKIVELAERDAEIARTHRLSPDGQEDP